jgi:alpha-L-rhamnosidase
MTDLRCEYGVNPLGLSVPNPCLSWRIATDRQRVRQTAYHLRVFDAAGKSLWDTNKVLSDRTTNICYQGLPLSSLQRCTWQGRVWDEQDTASEWSDTASWEMALLTRAEWRARWIEPEQVMDPKHFQPCPYLRTEFDVDERPVRCARVYATCHGVYELSLNGTIVGDMLFAPGFTPYDRRLDYQTYAIEQHLQPGSNALGVILGDGWYRGQINALSQRNVYGSRLALLLQVYIEYADGTEQWVITDQHWKTAPGPILKSDMKDGECYDARLELTGWDRAGYDDSQWNAVNVVEHSYDSLKAFCGVPARRKETFTPTILHTPNGQTVLDFGQNIAGRVRVTASGQAGMTIRMTHGETLDAQSNFTMLNHNPKGALIKLSGYPGLLQQVEYTFKGDGIETYEPRFSFQGFRYVLLEGFPGEPRPDQFTAIAIYSDMRETGHFSCSNPLLNQLHSNILWSMKGNFLYIPTDCPQRERAGWTGDAQVFAAAASVLMETTGFFRDWLASLALEQRPDGLVPNLVPDSTRLASGGIISATNGSSGWGDAAVIIPWTLYHYFCDPGVLERQYDSMKAWVNYMTQRAQQSNLANRLFNPGLRTLPKEQQRYIWDTNYHWGEWLEPDNRAFNTLIHNMFFGSPSVATAFFAYSTGLLGKAARLLGKTQDADQYDALAHKVRQAWQQAFIAPDGTLRPDRQATYVRALAFDLLPPEMRARVAQRLVELVDAKQGHLDTGFLSTGFLCSVLTAYGYADKAYEVLLQETSPSWLYAVRKNATTIWEQWDSITPDHTFKALASLNHYSPGAVAIWFYEYVAGIRAGSPGYKHIIIDPYPGGGLSSAQASILTLHGEVYSAWRLDGDTFHLHVGIPPNTSAEVRLPTREPQAIYESGVALGESDAVKIMSQTEKRTHLALESGEYQFHCPYLL